MLDAAPPRDFQARGNPLNADDFHARQIEKLRRRIPDEP